MLHDDLSRYILLYGNMQEKAGGVERVEERKGEKGRTEERGEKRRGEKRRGGDDRGKENGTGDEEKEEKGEEIKRWNSKSSTYLKGCLKALYDPSQQ